MNEAFLKLSSEKKETILNAAYKEFSERGYEEASTNTIARQAGIGKGTLFYYFGNKEKLFHALIETAFEQTYDVYFSKIDYDQTDFFKRLDEVNELKQSIYQRYPYSMRFLSEILMGLDKYPLSEAELKKRAEVEAAWADILKKNIDLTKFREDLSRDSVLDLVRWTVDGFRLEAEAKVKKLQDKQFDQKTIESIYEEYEQLKDQLRKIYYKQSAE